MNTEAVALAGLEVGHVAVANEARLLGQRQTCLLPGVVKKAKLDRIGDLGEDREVDPGAVERGAQRIRLAGPDIQGRVRSSDGRIGCKGLSGQVTSPGSWSFMRAPCASFRVGCK
jgi:hypothetical protein